MLESIVDHPADEFANVQQTNNVVTTSIISELPPNDNTNPTTNEENEDDEEDDDTKSHARSRAKEEKIIDFKTFLAHMVVL